MKYSKIVHGGFYERSTARGIQRGTVVSTQLRTCGTVTGELHIPGFPPKMVSETTADDFGNWRYVGGGLPFEGYATPDISLTGPEQMFPPQSDLDVDALSWPQLRAMASERGIPTHKRTADLIRHDLLNALTA